MSTTELGERHQLVQNRNSLQRVDNYDFAITKKNNAYSSEDKLLRADPSAPGTCSAAGLGTSVGAGRGAI